ncbi:hypothetical protein [Alkalibacillus aidingensis]|uniref:hypothetical protein n=1 Tax=Alkalibacillus aidingensis TaxID=2747607 RepID=UPI00166084E8|nr:hypothetical protein [Alkalibacillus aidingensis]
MSFAHHFVLLIVTIGLALILRVVQLRSFTKIDLYIFVFGPLLIMSVIMLFFALMDVNRMVFIDIGRTMAIHTTFGLLSGYFFNQVIQRL